MKKSSLLKGVLGIGLVLSVCTAIAAEAQKKVLVVTTTLGFRHSSIPTAEKVIADIGKESGLFTVEYAQSGNPPPEPRKPSEPRDKNDAAAKARYEEALAKFTADEPRLKAAYSAWREKVTNVLAEKMSADALKKYDLIIFANTTGDLPLPDKEAFLQWLRSGKGFVGMHSCSDTFHGWPAFIEMLGGEFQTHGAQATVDCINKDKNHPATKHLGDAWRIHDEIYILKNYHGDKVHELLTLDKEPNSKAPGDYPIAWCKDYGQGKVFYTSLGHREDVWESDVYKKHVLGGIKWAMGLEKGDSKPQKTAASAASGSFRPLFNGKDLTGWKLRNPGATKTWRAENGLLRNVVNKGEHGTDLVTEEKFRDFVARFEYKIPEKSNSGFYLRGRHEIQIADDYSRGRPTMGGNGAIYQVAPVSKFVSKAPGEWQKAEVTMVGNKVTLILNGEKVHDSVEVNKATGGELDRNLDQPGPIMLQGDHGSIDFRNIEIKELK